MGTRVSAERTDGVVHWLDGKGRWVVKWITDIVDANRRHRTGYGKERLLSVSSMAGTEILGQHSNSLPPRVNEGSYHLTLQMRKQARGEPKQTFMWSGNCKWTSWNLNWFYIISELMLRLLCILKGKKTNFVFIYFDLLLKGPQWLYLVLEIEVHPLLHDRQGHQILLLLFNLLLQPYLPLQSLGVLLQPPPKVYYLESPKHSKCFLFSLSLGSLLHVLLLLLF